MAALRVVAQTMCLFVFIQFWLIIKVKWIIKRIRSKIILLFKVQQTHSKSSPGNVIAVLIMLWGFSVQEGFAYWTPGMFRLRLLTHFSWHQRMSKVLFPRPKKTQVVLCKSDFLKIWPKPPVMSLTLTRCYGPTKLSIMQWTGIVEGKKLISC